MRRLLLFTVGFALSSVMLAYFEITGWGIVAVSMAICILLAVFLGKYRKVLCVSMCLLGFSIGSLWCLVFDSYYLYHARNVDDQTYQVSIVASDYSYDTSYGSAFDGKVTLADKTYSVKVYLKTDLKLNPGDEITGPFRFRLTTSGGAQEATHHRGDGTYLLAYQAGEISLRAAHMAMPSYYPQVWRQKLIITINNLFPEDIAGFARALLLGDRSGIGYEVSTAFKLSGISHIIAVSGLHVSILFSLIHLFTAKRRWLTALIGIPSVLLFAAIAGFTPSITRACLMQILIIVANLLDKEYDPPTSLAFAVLVMLLINPLSIISVSLQLSVGCIAGIQAFSGKISAWLQDRSVMGSLKGRGILPSLKRWLVSSVSVTLSACVITTPLVAIYFGCVSLLSVLTNLLTLWVVTFIFYGILLVCAAGSVIPTVAGALAIPVCWMVKYVLCVAKTVASLPLSAVYTESIYTVIWLISAYVMLALYLLMKRKPTVIFSCCCVLTLCASILASWIEPMLYDVRMTVLDVGQGQCILLQSNGRTFVVDCGGSSPETAADKAADTLLSMGISRVDGIILTHYDADHTGGLLPLLSRISTECILAPDIVSDTEAKRQIVAEYGDITMLLQEDAQISLGSSAIHLFASKYKAESNESGLCILFDGENCDILITGDRGELGETLLVKTRQLPEVDVLIAGHHGSKYSTGKLLLDTVKPDTVIISAGADNPYGHPATELLERLASYGIRIYRTDLNGTVIFRR